MDTLATSPVEALAARLQAGEPAALARAITVVENARPGADELLALLRSEARGALSVGITGPPGAGKSTLISALVAELRKGDRRVAVLAVDPSSPLTGGAILGDRTRMGEHTADPDVFIRSISSRGHLGGLAAAIYDIVDLVDAAAWDVVIVETVGAGQSETEIASIADVRVVVLAPGLGDDVQAIKAGILEIADVLVVNKADRDDAERTARQLEGMLDLRADDAVPVEVLLTTATERTGVDELVKIIDGHDRVNDPEHRRRRRAERLRGAIAANAGDMIRQAVLNDSGQMLEAEIAAVLAGRKSIRAALPAAIRAVLGAGAT
jgi:LAO/AO transport system kinase